MSLATTTIVQKEVCDLHAGIVPITPPWDAPANPATANPVVSRGAVRSAASSYAAMRTVAGSRPVLVIV